MDFKVMPKSYRGHKSILCIIDELTNCLITINTSSQIRGSRRCTNRNVITKYCIPKYIIMDQDSAFMFSLMNHLFNKFDIKIKTVVPYNHHSLQPEHGIKSLSNILTKHLTSPGQMWPKYLPISYICLQHI